MNKQRTIWRINVNTTKTILAAALILFLPLFAQAEGKIAVLDAQQAILNTDEAQKKLKEFREQPSIAENVKEIEKLQKEFKAAVEDFQKNSAVMSAAQKEEERKKITEKQSDIEHVARKLKASEQEMGQMLLQEFSPKLNEAVSAIIKSEGIGLLLNRQAVMHLDSSFSITAKVTDKLNQAK